GDVQCLIISINQANTNGQPQNTIRLEAGTYTLTNIDNFTPNFLGPNGLPSITSTLTIKGAGANMTIIARDSGAVGFRLMHVAASGNLTLEGVTLTGGGSLFGGPSGGGLYNDGGQVTLTNSTFLGNRGDPGGGLWSNGGRMTNQQSAINQNFSIHEGGAVGIVGGAITVINSTRSPKTAQMVGLSSQSTVQCRS